MRENVFETRRCVRHDDDFTGSEGQKTSLGNSRRLGNLSPSLLSFKILEESDLD